jgi:hypothetical protein
MENRRTAGRPAALPRFPVASANAVRATISIACCGDGQHPERRLAGDLARQTPPHSLRLKVHVRE